MYNKQLQAGLRAMLLALAAGLATISMAGDMGDKHQFNIQGQPLGAALVQLSNQSGMQLIMQSQDGASITTEGLKGLYSTQEALDKLLAGSGLDYVQKSDNTVIIRVAEALENTGNNAKKESRSSDKRVIEEVIVTAQKREQSLHDVPISILALTDEDIEVRKITDLYDLALAVPGLVLSDSPVTGRRIYMRGLGNLSGSGSMVGIYVDDIPVSSGDALAQLDTRLHDVERVEVLRGPQGTLYGQGAMAGTIRFITKDPQLDGFGFNANVQASFTQDGSPSQRTQAVVNMPLVADTLGLRVSGTFEHAGGWIDQPISDQEDINTQDVANVRVKGLWRPIGPLSVEGTVIVHRNESAGTQHELDNGDAATPAFDVFTPAMVDDKYELYNLTLSYDFDGVNFLSTSSYVNAERSFRDFGFQFGDPAAPLHGFYNPFELKSNTVAQEVRLSSTGTGRWQWTVGGLYEEWELDAVFTGFFGVAGPLPSSPSFSLLSNPTSESWAVFGDISYALTPRLEMGLGLRYFEDDRTLAGYASNVLIRNFEGSYDSINPRFYVNYDVTDEIKLYSSAAKGFRSGGDGGLFSFLAGVPKGHDPETVWTYELGVKGASFGGRLAGDVALFYTDYSDAVQTVVLPGGLSGSVTTNAGDARIKGVEGSLTWQIGDDLRFGLIGTWQDSEFTSVIGTQRPKLPGDKLDLVKDYQFTLWAEQTFILANRPGSVRVDYNQQGPSEYSTRTSNIFVETDVINMLNLHATWEWSDNLHLGVFGQNMLNDRDVVHPLGVGLPVAYTRSRPRTIGIEFGVDF